MNLICVEDGIDSSKDAGKLMISVLSAVAEIERENIRVQTMERRMHKVLFSTLNDASSFTLNKVKKSIAFRYICTLFAMDYAYKKFPIQIMICYPHIGQ